MSLRGLCKPEYFYRPSQLLRRLARGAPSSETVEVRLPWGANLRVHPRDNIGAAVYTLGIFDLAVTEALWRLADPSETAIDAGANLGYMTAVLAHCVSPGGTVFSFEPHPILFQEMADNVDRQRSSCQVEFHPEHAALAEHPGTVTLQVPADFSANRGIASVLTDLNAVQTSERIDVPAKVLDDVLGARWVGVMKIDVEGYELQVLHGARRLLEERRIRDIVFEHHEAYPSPVAQFLESMQMTLFRLHRSFRGPVLLPPASAVPRTYWESTSFIASFDADRVKSRFSARGWKCLA